MERIIEEHWGKIVLSFFGFIIVLALIFGSIYKVDEGQRGIILRNGEYAGFVEPGLKGKIPFFDKVIFNSVQTFTIADNNIHTYSRDQQPSVLGVSVTFSVPATEEASKILYQNHRSIEGLVQNVIRPYFNNEVKSVFGRYNAVNAVQERAKLVTDITTSLQEKLSGFPIVIHSVQVENIDFSDVYEQTVEARMRAEVDVKTQEQNLEKERVLAEIKVTQAQADADSQLAKAKAQAEAIRLRGDAEAEAIKVKTEALAQNQNLVELTKAERWDGKLPQTTLSGNGVPLFNMK